MDVESKVGIGSRFVLWSRRGANQQRNKAKPVNCARQCIAKGERRKGSCLKMHA